MSQLNSTRVLGTLIVDSFASIGGSLSANTLTVGATTLNSQLTSTVATGTAPFVVASTTLVTNLNAQYLNGQSGTYYAQDSTVVKLSGNQEIAGTKTFNSTITGSVSGNAGTVTNGVYTTGSYADPAWITSLAKSKVGLTNVENTALSTWAGTSNITTLGTIGSGTWQGGVISSTYGGTGVNNGGRTLTINTNNGTLSFTNASTTLTIANNASVSGTNTGDQTVNNGTLSWAASTTGATNTTVAASLSGAYSANTADNRTMSLAIGPAITALATTMTGAGTGFLRKNGADTYSLDTSTYLTSASTLTAGNLSGTIPSAVLGNSSLFIGTTSVALNRASASLALTGVTNTNWDAAHSHISSDGSSHSFINQSVTTAANPTFASVTGTNGLITGSSTQTWEIDGTGTNLLLKSGSTGGTTAVTVTAAGVVTAASFFNVGATTNGFRGATGDTAGGPSFTWAADLDTGIWNPASDAIGFSTGGTNRMTIQANGTVDIPNNLFSAVRSLAATTAANNTAVEVFSFVLQQGSYRFVTSGTITKTNATNSRQYQVIFSCNSTPYEIFASAIFSPNTAVSFNTGTAMSNYNHTIINTPTTSLTAATNTYFAGATNSTPISNMPFFVSGNITVPAQRTFRVHIRQSTGSGTDTVSVNAGSFMNIIRI
jgi:hypothetical protein